MSFTKQNSGARRIFRFMGWAGSLVVPHRVYWSSGQGAYQLLPMLPFVLPLVCDLVLTRWGRKRWDRNVVVGRRKTKEVWAAYFTSQVFLPLVALVYLLANPVVQDVVLQSGQSSERSAIASHIKNHTKSKDTIYAWDATATLYQESDRLAASALLTPNVLSGN